MSFFSCQISDNFQQMKLILIEILNQNFRALRALNSSSCRGLARFAHQRSCYAQPHLGASPPQLHLHLFGSGLNFFPILVNKNLVLFEKNVGLSQIFCWSRSKLYLVSVKKKIVSVKFFWGLSPIFCSVSKKNSDPFF